MEFLTNNWELIAVVGGVLFTSGSTVIVAYRKAFKKVKQACDEVKESQLPGSAGGTEITDKEKEEITNAFMDAVEEVGKFWIVLSGLFKKIKKAKK